MSSFECPLTVSLNCVCIDLTIQHTIQHKLHSGKEGIHDLDHPDIISKEIKQMQWGQENTFY